MKKREELRKWYLKELGDLVRRLDKATTEEECYEVMRKKSELREELEEKDPELSGSREIRRVSIEMWNTIQAKIAKINGTKASHMH